MRELIVKRLVRMGEILAKDTNASIDWVTDPSLLSKKSDIELLNMFVDMVRVTYGVLEK